MEKKNQKPQNSRQKDQTPAKSSDQAQEGDRDRPSEKTAKTSKTNKPNHLAESLDEAPRQNH